ncbi:MAG: cupin domain-containing protein [Pseudomonadota bacterium]
MAGSQPRRGARGALAIANPDEIIAQLNLIPHPEGGWYRETWAAEASSGARAAGTAIYYLLKAGERSHWHRVDSAEIWHFYAGAPLALAVAPPGAAAVRHVLGPDLGAGQRPQLIVPPGDWQSAASQGAWTLVGCTVSPGFMFEHFEMAAPGWAPPGGQAAK